MDRQQMREKNNCIMLYDDMIEAMKDILSYPEGERLIAEFIGLIIRYYDSDEEIDDKSIPIEIRLAFKMFKRQFNRQIENYANLCETNRRNGVLGGRPKGSTNKTGKDNSVTSDEKSNALIRIQQQKKAESSNADLTISPEDDNSELPF